MRTTLTATREQDRRGLLADAEATRRDLTGRLNALTLPELQQLAKDLGIDLYARRTKKLTVERLVYWGTAHSEARAIVAY